MRRARRQGREEDPTAKAPAAPRSSGSTRRPGAGDRTWDLLVFIVFRVFSLVCRALGASGSAGLGYLLGIVFGVFDRRRRLVLRHMVLAVGPGRAQSLIPKYYEHVGLLAVEYARLGALTPQELGECCLPGELGRLREIAARGKGVILVTGHVGDWEIMGQALAVWGLPLHALYRPLENQYLDRHARGVRERNGIVVHGRSDAARTMVRLLRAGKVMVLLMDQDGSEQGVFVPFFGLLASTLPTAARLARRTGAAIVPATTCRLRSRMKHWLRVGPEIELARTGDEERDVILTTWRCNRAFEEAILEHPPQWLWAYRRWRTRPGIDDIVAWEMAVEGIKR